MKTKELLTLIGALCLTLALGVIPFTSSATAASTTKKAWKWPKTLTIGMYAVGGTEYNVTVGWAPVMEADTGMKIRVVPVATDTGRLAMLRMGTVDIIGSAATLTGIDAIEANSGFANRQFGPYLTPIVWQNASSNSGFIVRGDSDIKTVYDIKPGMRCAYFMAAPAAAKRMDCLLAWARVSKDDIIPVPFSTWSANILSVVEGKADIAYASAGAAHTFKAAASPHGIRFLDLAPEDKEGQTRFLNVLPGVKFGKLTSGVPVARGTNGFMLNFYYTAKPDTDPELVYHLAKWLSENYDAYKDKHPMCEAMNSLDLVDFAAVHPGTIKYLKEKGLWTSANNVSNEKTKELFARYKTAWDTAVAKADEKGIKVKHNNQEWIDLWNSYKKEIPRMGVPQD